MELNERILKLRKEHGMTQDELAEALLVSRKRYINGKQAALCRTSID